MAIKLAAIKVLLDDLLIPCKPLWDIFGDRWRLPQYYSLILQPFIISPIINTGDIMVAMKRCGVHISLEDAIRLYHPFPILERYVTSDVLYKGKVVVPAHTQIMMFTSDFNQLHATHESTTTTSTTTNTTTTTATTTTSNPHKASDQSTKSTVQSTTGVMPMSMPYPWPIFGNGDRSCAGMHLALPFLRILRNVLIEGSNADTVNTTSGTTSGAASGASSGLTLTLDAMFQPEINHLYSVRHNDVKIESLSEMIYFIKVVVSAMWSAKATPEELVTSDNEGRKCPVSTTA